MNDKITIDDSLCTKCRVCAEICPNGIFRTETGLTTVRPERVQLCVSCGQCMAACPESAIQVDGLDYSRDFSDLPENDDADVHFDKLIRSRRSVRSFKDKPVPRDKLEQIVSAVTFSPPSFPPIKTALVVVQDKQMIRESLPYMVDLYDKLLKGLKHPVAKFFIKKEVGPYRMRTIQNHIIPMFSIKLPFMKDGTEDSITRNAPAMILFHADRNSENYRTDIYIALAYALLKAHSLGLGATAIDLIPPAIEKSPRLKILFRIPDQNEVVAAMILGYPKYKYRRAINRQLSSVTWIN
ncbi:MAG: nitroreductase family protein [Bacteroidales bacterium]|nr:nitroreductase family protein [Bacteroidales bacterium]MBN2632405.1 nitroreductase family protein [Bacteroidales bacterium]